MKENDPCLKMINDGVNKIGEIYHLSESLPENRIRDLITQTVILAKKIYDQLEKKPDHFNKLPHFHNFFMETASQFIVHYCALIMQKKIHENNDIKIPMETTLEKLKSSFQKQHDTMFEMDILEFSAEIDVLLKTLKSEEGL